MLKQLILENWRSFSKAELPLNPITVLLGKNASGKSNAIDALQFLKRTVKGEEIQAALSGYTTVLSGVEGAVRNSTPYFTLKVLIQGENERINYLYVITVQTQPQIQLFYEYLVYQEYKPNQQHPIQTSLLETHLDLSNSPQITAEIYSDENTNLQVIWKRDHSILSQIKGVYSPSKLVEGIKVVSQTLEEIFILNPIPDRMQHCSRLAHSLTSDASNIAGVLAALPEKQKIQVESTISVYTRQLLEVDIQRIWTEKVGKFATEAMLYCEELWQPDQLIQIDATSLSDGTLRWLAILTALLTRPPGSQMIIENVDYGLYPSHFHLIWRIIQEIAARQKVDLLVTTHNPVLVETIESEAVFCIVVAHRDLATGESKLTLVKNIKNLARLMTSGSLDKVTVNGAVEKIASAAWRK
ncbi:MAG: AAA family ATPase [Symploca sp. SIO2C1]|nr:AAA family ATPase [Symploca sp. SIO2C1]